MDPVNKSRHTILHALLMTTILLAAAAVQIPPASGTTVTDDAGTVIAFNATPFRIVSLSPSNTEILAALGLTGRIVGVTDVCDYPPSVKNITRIGGYSSISIEKVAAARPDLVIASDITPQESVGRLRELGLSVIVVAPKNIEHMIRDIRMLGTLTGTESRAGELAENLSARIAAVSPCPSAKGHPTVAHIVWHEPLYVSGNNTLQNDVIILAGGENVFASEDGWSTVPLEEFLVRNPDIIIVNGGGGMDSSSRDIIYEELTGNPQYASLSAVKNNRVYAVNADTISRPAPRIVGALEEVARLIHPECYPEDSSAPAAGATPTIPTQAPGFTSAVAVLIVTMVVATRPFRKR
jgi:iron complex transport system substrate-binding protein